MLRIFLIVILLPVILFAQESSGQTVSEKIYPVGKCTRVELESGEFGEHFQNEYSQYKPDIERISELKEMIGEVDILIVLGTWCHDSQVQIPRFFKILDQLEIENLQPEIICVDRNKTAPDISVDELNIERVPTFILLKNEQEIGRIIETPEKTLESDLVKILTK